ncbi:hypothetical protein H9Q72_003504 [Fusarium xylarioides]|uniref:Peptidase S8/S53 domain-containing protein n=1 Tax=Fusarium xylarioides TaxID=221167 RepID=A0A9P7I6G1_9HYPO|nr:hypothetical protein H9Q72_003504 [Fusarium xylarioides]
MVQTGKEKAMAYPRPGISRTQTLPGGSKKEKSSTPAQGNKDGELRDILHMATGIDNWKQPSATRTLKNKIMNSQSFGSKGDKFLHHLMQAESQKDNQIDDVWEFDVQKDDGISSPKVQENFTGVGRKILRWMLSDANFRKYFTQKPSSEHLGEDQMTKSTPIHWALENSYFAFIACLLNIYIHCSESSMRKSLDGIFEKQHDNKRNAIHYAAHLQVPFMPFLAFICPANALTSQDSSGCTPLHIALQHSEVTKALDAPLPCTDAGTNGWDKTFSPLAALKVIDKRDDSSDLMQKILTTTNNKGDSLFTECRLRKDLNQDFRSYLRRLIFDKVKKVPDVSTALYAYKGDTKELCLDMSDFNQSSHDFEAYVQRLKQVDEKVLEFEETLLFVHLPDLNYVKQPCPPKAISELFNWLKDRGVKTIRKLSIPDNTTNPLSDVFVQHYILNTFRVEELDWRKLDVNLDIFFRKGMGEHDLLPSNCLKGLRLYSSGNWSVLYHWISSDGLEKLPKLRKVSIDVILLEPTKDYYDEKTRKQHENMTSGYAHRLEEHAKGKTAYELEVKHNAKWYYPLSSLDPDETAAQVLQHPFTGQLESCFSALDVLSNGNSRATTDDTGEERMERFCEFALHPDYNPSVDPDSKQQDRRIKVAIIDNGADRVRFAYRDMIAKGQSYVNAEVTGSDRLLPWWMVSDPHGTQMASLIGQTNPYCRLYVARVGRGRSDIQPEAATKAIHWAIENHVDIISMSWTLNKPNTELNRAIKSAHEKGIVVFCSTADEGALSNAEPVGEADHVLTVSATDRWGHLTSKAITSRKVDVLIEGENIVAPAPDYMINQSNTVSGSSVATALAAGIASLALLMIRTFSAGEDWDEEMKDELSAARRRERIKSVFDRMAEPNTAIKLTKLFPIGSDDDIVLEELARLWQDI